VLQLPLEAGTKASAADPKMCGREPATEGQKYFSTKHWFLLYTPLLAAKSRRMTHTKTKQ